MKNLQNKHKKDLFLFFLEYKYAKCCLYEKAQTCIIAFCKWMLCNKMVSFCSGLPFAFHGAAGQGANPKVDGLKN